MLLKNIQDVSIYITDENIDQVNLVPTVNQAIAFINTKAATNLPFVANENIGTNSYAAISDSWQARIFEPYIVWTMFQNDGALQEVQFHYERLLDAVNDFLRKGEVINVIDPNTGEETDYGGSFSNSVEIDATALYVDFGMGFD